MGYTDNFFPLHRRYNALRQSDSKIDTAPLLPLTLTLTPNPYPDLLKVRNIEPGPSCGLQSGKACSHRLISGVS